MYGLSILLRADYWITAWAKSWITGLRPDFDWITVRLRLDYMIMLWWHELCTGGGARAGGGGPQFGSLATPPPQV